MVADYTDAPRGCQSRREQLTCHVYNAKYILCFTINPLHLLTADIVEGQALVCVDREYTVKKVY